MSSGRLLRLGLLAALLLGSLTALWVHGIESSADGRDDVDPTDRLDPARPVDEQTLWAIGIIDGKPFTEDDVARRLSAYFLAELPPEAFVASIDRLRLAGPIRFEGVIDRNGEQASVVRLRTDSGEPFMLITALSDDPTRLDGLRVVDYTPPNETHPPIALALGLTAVAALAVVAMQLAPNALGPTRSWWMLAAAGLWLSQFAEASSSAWSYTASIALPWGAVGIVLALAGLEAIGTDRPAVLNAGAAVGGLVSTLVGAGPITAIRTESIGLPRNLVARAATEATAAARLADVRALAAVAALLVAGLVAVEFRRQASTSRRARLPVMVSVAAMAFLLAVAGAGWLAGSGTIDLSPSALISLALLVGVAGSGSRRLTDRLRLGDMAQLVVDLGEDPAGASIETALRRALDDPTLELVIHPHDVEPHDPLASRAIDGRAVTKLELDGRPLGLVIHDGHHRPEQVRTACSAVGLAIRNAQLEAEVRSQLDEVRASRSRLLTATDDARRAMERDLHDGAQQRILSAMVEIQRAKRRLGHDPEAAGDALDLAAEQLETTLEEVRDIARGLRPGAMDRGLLPAVRELADRCPLPVNVHGDRSRSDSAVEHAAWFVISEALTNVTRHARATVVDVGIDADADGVSVTVADDGCGGATPVQGGGLEGIVDRVEALGGTVSIDSPSGVGTALTLFLPAPECEASM